MPIAAATAATTRWAADPDEAAPPGALAELPQRQQRIGVFDIDPQ